MRLATGPQASTMPWLSDTDTRPGGVEEDGVLVPSLHQSDVSHVGNVPAATES